MKSSSVLAILALSVVATACSESEARQAADDRFSGRSLQAATTGASTNVYNLTGDAHVQPVDGSMTEVKAFIHGRDRRQLVLENARSGISVRYPGERIVVEGASGEAMFQVDEKGVFPAAEGRNVTLAPDGPGLEARAHLRVSLPAEHSAILHLGHGRVSLDGSDEEFASADGVLRVVVENRGGVLHAQVQD